ncbi:conserved protein of unknown function [Rhodovastum atsumiense]|uniref:Uncharacterized protein n=1 Tax=Rhodovastum atsumiense TaxID=504468 RepID=A0A5M6J127_9PROT|nr:hypothetical protein [Rhodovastum atsumiense]KAA5613909.1 hypothetical protein F1189_03800 [Rhodovastum atsumiense]CAH2602039.1 conserved protein of unknown function [Rhodovastum atsumiense]
MTHAPSQVTDDLLVALEPGEPCGWHYSVQCAWLNRQVRGWRQSREEAEQEVAFWRRHFDGLYLAPASQGTARRGH